MKTVLFMVVCSTIIFYSCENDTNKIVDGNHIMYEDGVICTESVVYNFGKVSYLSCDSIYYSFKLKNISKEIVPIDEIEASCPCISINEYAKSIKPLHSVLVEGYVKIPANKGNFNKPLFVRYNEGKVLLLRIRGNVM